MRGLFSWRQRSCSWPVHVREVRQAFEQPGLGIGGVVEERDVGAAVVLDEDGEFEMLGVLGTMVDDGDLYVFETGVGKIGPREKDLALVKRLWYVAFEQEPRPVEPFAVADDLV